GERADLEAVAVAHQRLPIDRPAVEEGPVAALQVPDAHPSRPGGDGTVQLADQRAVRAEVTLAVPADQEDGRGQRNHSVFMLAVENDQLHFHDVSFREVWRSHPGVNGYRESAADPRR